MVGQAPYLASARNGIYPRPGPALRVKLINSTKDPYFNNFQGFCRAYLFNFINQTKEINETKKDQTDDDRKRDIWNIFARFGLVSIEKMYFVF